MFELFPDMMDKPDSQSIGASLAYILAAFLILPFFLLFFALEFFSKPMVVSWVETGFHGITFLFCLKIYGSYLASNFRTARNNLGRFFLVTGLGIFACLGIWLFYAFNSFRGGIYECGSILGFPITEHNLLDYPVFLFEHTPISTLLCVSLIVPVSVCCLYYGTAFAPGCYDKPWLGYLLVTGLIAVPRFVNCLMFRWDTATELYTLAAQLPIHWIACFCYEQTDSIWAPILIHVVTNFIGSLFVMVLLVL